MLYVPTRGDLERRRRTDVAPVRGVPNFNNYLRDVRRRAVIVVPGDNNMAAYVPLPPGPPILANVVDYQGIQVVDRDGNEVVLSCQG